MNQKIRPSILSDAADFMTIKERLALSVQTESSTQGGFLLGTDLITYQFYIENGLCLTALVEEAVVGFGIVLPDFLIRNSDLWTKRTSIQWKTDLKEMEDSQLAYLEQLAFLKGHRKLSLSLAYQLAKLAFDNNADMIITTTVRKPTLNLAAVPYIKAVGGTLIGNIDEVYADVGAINSDIYQIRKTVFNEKIVALPFYDFLAKGI